MKNDKVHLQSDREHRPTNTERRGPEGMAMYRQTLWQSSTDESYTDGYVDYTHEL